MITTMLVDDDKSALDYLEGLINWESYGFEIVGRAGDGDAALRLFNRLRPQLIITDVHMPVMTGIELARHVRQSDAKVRIIFSSSYIEPEYLLAALHMGVDDYILKHELNEKSLLDRLMMVSHELRSAEYNAHLAFGKLVADFLEKDSELPESNDSVVGRMLDRQYQAILLQEDSVLPPFDDYLGYVSPVKFMSDTVSTCSQKSNIQAVTIKIQKNRYLLMVKSDSSSSKLRSRTVLHAFTRSLQGVLRDQTGSSFSMILMPVETRTDQFKPVWKRMNDGLASSRFFLSNFSLFYDEVPSGSTAGPPMPLSELEAVLDAGDQHKLGQLLSDRMDALRKACDAQGASLFCSRCLELLTRRGSITTDHVTGESFELPVAGSKAGSDLAKMGMTWDHLMQWIAEQLMNLAALIAKNQSLSFPASVLKAIEFIRQNYSRPDLSVDDIASHAGRGRNRFGLLFKDSTGLTIADYLTHHRIRKAAALIDSNCCKIYEVALLAGYTTSQYFSKVFKKVTGMTPYEYKTGSAADRNKALELVNKLGKD